MHVWGGGLLVKNHGRRESRDAESKGRGGMQRAKQKEGRRLVFMFMNVTLGLGLEKTSYLYLFFFFKCWPD